IRDFHVTGVQTCALPILVAANHDNKNIQGDDLANDSRPNTVRVGTHTQIMDKVVGASTTVEATDKAGRRSELARNIMKAGRELKIGRASCRESGQMTGGE